jgi:PAS domain S-box-containing protein
MKDQRKTKKQLIEELTGLRQRILGPERIENERNQAEEALRESEARYRSMFDHSLDAILLTAPDGQILAANSGACSILGYAETELRQLGRAGVVDPADSRLPLALAERRRTGKFKGDLTFVRKDRSKFEAEVSSAVFRDQDGFERTSMIFRDITDRKRMEEVLRQSEEKYRNAFNYAPLGFAVWDKDYHILEWNEQAEIMFGWSRDEAIGRNFFELIVSEKGRSRVEGIVEDLMRGRIERRIVHENVKKNGEPIWCEWNNGVLRDNENGIVGGISLALDVTQRKRMEEELRKSRGFLNSILDTAPMLIYVTSTDNRYRLVNKAWEEFVGRDREEVIGLSMEQMFSLTTSQRFRDQNKRIVDHGLPLVFEEQVSAPGGTHYFYTIKFPLFDDRGKVEAVGGISLDITEKKQGEERIKEMGRFLEAVIDNANIWVDVLDENANVVIWNKAAEAISGYSSQEVIGHDNI